MKSYSQGSRSTDDPRVNMKQAQIPMAFIERMHALMGTESEALVRALEDAPVVGLRVNSLMISAEQLRHLVPFALEPMAIPDGFRLMDEAGAGKHPFHAAGLYYLQDPAAMAAAWLLAPQPGERVLDLAAAPGGKTTHLAALMQNQGLLVANEIDRQRAWDLVENLERLGVQNTIVTNEHPQRLADKFTDFFDRVLLDAPCSGEGMFGKSGAARMQWSKSFVQSCSVRQKQIIRSAAKMVRPGGRLAYVTCAFSPEENEGVVADFLAEHSDFSIVDLPRLEGFAPGVSAWVSAEANGLGLEKAVRLWPHRWPGGGHFVTILERAGESEGVDLFEMRTQRFYADTEQAIVVFASDTWKRMPDFGELTLMGDNLIALPEEHPDLRDLKVLRFGLKLGEISKGRFEPAHSLVMAVPGDLARRNVNLAPDSPELKAYMRGESFTWEGEAGWVVVTVEGYPLGWGKRVSDVVKNHYPRNLRRG